MEPGKDYCKPMETELVFNKTFLKYLKDIVDKCKESGEWRTRLSVKIAFSSSEYINEYLDMYLWSDR